MWGTSGGGGTPSSVNARQLLVSNPPHGDVDAAAASHFGLTAAEVRMKANYGLPEIWFAEKDEAELLDIDAALDAAGLDTVLVAGGDLVGIPGQSPAESFAFTDGGLWVGRDDSGLTMAYDAPAIGVFSRPRVDVQDAKSPAKSIASQLSGSGRMGFRRRSPGASQVESVAAPFLDLYTPSDTGLLRVSIVQDITSFSMIPANLPHGLSAMQNLVAECEDQFETAHFDRRLVDMRLRGLSRVVTRPAQTRRTGFSYATEALTKLLGSLSPDLRDISQADLSSRLAYLTNRSLIS